ncbi:MAG: RsbRD N-terminal domain-containing protein [Ignavibacteriales bacterium]|nr:RsbRD N-terminal domain-containing protein [Ignavibacteriales bacterium]MCF8307194.1 RsbRD N-terminal domain-containing protein [Ignavibacteriales bacterium]MCF8315199.1 RsbRD N-terminal domain-containing protein [Ignavibacteriales bacterium]MCF8438474.1 RsbRD N-terminal domain-containing protein [Ignavibacteriales bacterium]
MVNHKLTGIIKENLDAMTANWAEEVTKSEVMSTYHKFDEASIRERGKAVFVNLAKWLEGGAKIHEVEEYFEKVGFTRLEEGFPLSEVHYAIYLSKKIFWNYVDWRDAVTGTFTTSSATQVMAVFNNYFDLSSFHVTNGYFKGLISKLDSYQKLTKNDLMRLFLKGNVVAGSDEDDDFVWRPV